MPNQARQFINSDVSMAFYVISTQTLVLFSAVKLRAGVWSVIYLFFSDLVDFLSHRFLWYGRR